MRLGRLIFFLLLSFAHLACGQDTFTAKVIRIIDGDTMEVLYRNRPVKIRLVHIDRPEKRKSQPYGNKALSDLCFGQTVRITGEKRDRYGRLLAVVVNGKKQNINQEISQFTLKLSHITSFKKRFCHHLC